MNKQLSSNWTFFKAFIRKEFHHIFRDHTSMLILLVMPVMMLLLFGYALNTEVQNSRFAVYDPSPNDATRVLIDKLQVNNYFVLAKTLTSFDQVEKAFQSGEVGMVVVFSPNHEQIQLLADGTDPNTASTITSYATSIITNYQMDKMRDGGIPYVITPEVKLLYNPSLHAAYNFVPGVMGMIILLICAMMTSISITREKERGTMELLLVSPMKPLYVILSKAVPYFVISLVNLATILLMAVYVMGVPIAGSFFWLMVLSLLYIFVCLALGLLISSVVNTQLVAMIISAMGLMMPVMLLSGMMFPVDNMPWFLRLISDFIPAKWYILATKKIMIQGLGVEAIVKEFLVLISMAFILITISLKNFKTRLE
jgi:ABC-2 type transport system permease protein